MKIYMHKHLTHKYFHTQKFSDLWLFTKTVKLFTMNDFRCTVYYLSLIQIFVLTCYKHGCDA